ncbi:MULTISPECIES: glycosyltransferase family 9 protein [unclassified Bradyrhizobium]|uniref:glycosyltransferase family 9 protein n=1 Tax=unclassified Bradyrhizobium TaxID=2631580 RepID=UPI001FF7205F|nr:MULTISPECIES: glycosyltransferase family 9 protein [unclassified Bradyrhizobium]MCK1345789.1 glycosyltransferase family 9 protein [Bradyrhizobium sp. CW11]MCK1587111.1 glycosyltransferase family 9 protein [Bradyrhizobium sp. 169]
MNTRENILVYRLGSLGDTIVALPCFHKIAESFPNARRILLTNIPVSTKAAPVESILGNSGLVDSYISYPIGTRSIGALWQLSQEIRALKIETLIYLMPARSRLKIGRDNLFFRSSGIRKIVGLPTTADLRNNQIDPVTAFEEPECERLARTLCELGRIDLESPAAWDLLLDADETRRGEEIISMSTAPLIAINMGGKALEKDWGVDRWLRLIRQLSVQHGNYDLLIVGASEDGERANVVRKMWPNTVINACGKLSPRESAAALRSATLFIGHDSGPLHLAAAVGVPCVGLFGGYNKPMKWHPYGKGHRVLHNMGGMSGISVDEVFEAASTLLSSSAAGPTRICLNRLSRNDHQH